MHIVVQNLILYSNLIQAEFFLFCGIAYWFWQKCWQQYYLFNYLQVLRIWLLTQNFSFSIAGGMVMELLFHSNLKSTNFVAFISLVILICFSGAIGALSALAGSILIEREWWFYLVVNVQLLSSKHDCFFLIPSKVPLNVVEGSWLWKLRIYGFLVPSCSK